jgi:hypothetical protein
MSRPYTGFDKYATGPSPALRYLVDATVWNSAGRLTNLGIFGIRPMRSKSKPSVHGTGRAADIGYAPYKTWPGSNRALMTQWIDFIIANADDLGVELLIDYSYTGGLGGGRTWKCDRHAWMDNKPGVIAGAGQASSKWIHIELAPHMWDDVIAVKSIIDHWEPEAPKPAKKAAPRKKA